jgi:predicted PurR-regulated permease PerM
MTRRQQVAVFWLVALVVLLVILYVLRSIMLPFVAGTALAYALDPVADWLEGRGLKRPSATIVILVISVVLLLLLLLLIGPVVVNQLSEFIQHLPNTIEQLQGYLSSFLDSDLAHYFGLSSEGATSSLGHFLTGGSDVISKLVPSLWSGGLAVLNILSLFIITPFVAFYLLRDWDKMVARIDDLLPRDHADEIRYLAHQIDHKTAAFVRGQMLSGLIMGIYYVIGLYLVGLNYALLIGMVAGMISFIPYAGFAVGFVISIGVAIVQFWPDWIWIVAVAAVFQAGQLLEGYVLQPRLHGRSASGMAAVRAVRLRPPVRLRRAAAGGAGDGGGRCARPSCGRALSGEPDVPGGRSAGRAVNMARPPARRQLALSLPHGAAMTRADFLTGAANREAVELIDRWPDWPSPVVLLAGPVGSGKSHLVEIWRARSGAAVTTAAVLTDDAVVDMVAAGAVAVEDLHAGPFDEAALFHLLNLARERGVPVLLTSRAWPAALPLALADLASRLRAAHPVELGEPDDELLRRVIVKLFADRQLVVDRAVVDYIVVRMERSLEAANLIVAALDRTALAEGRAITRPLAAEALARVFDGGDT